MSWRPEGWPKCPCDECEKKEEDEYGLLCNLACGKYTAWLNREAGADAMLEVRRPIDLMILGTLDCMIEGPATPIHHLKRVRYELEKVMGELHKGTEKDMQMLEEQP